MKKLISLGIVTAFVLVAFPAQAHHRIWHFGGPKITSSPTATPTASVSPTASPTGSATPTATPSVTVSPTSSVSMRHKNLRAACQVAAKDAYIKAKKDADKVYDAAKKINKGRPGKDARK